MKTICLVVLYFLFGFAEWYLATIRTWAIAQKRAVQSSIIAAIEESLGLFVLVYAIIFNPSQWWLLVFGVFGGAVGVYLGVRRSK